MVEDNNLPCAEELLRDGEGADGFRGAAACVADDVGVAFFKTEDPGGVYFC